MSWLGIKQITQSYNTDGEIPFKGVPMATNLRKMTVLIVDDNEMTRSLLRSIIQGDLFDVIGEASDGTSGLERAYKLKPDIVCLDVSMPGRDGLEILQEIKKVLKQTMVLMVTASHDVSTVQKAIQNGASGFIIKPFNIGTVQDTLESVALKLRELNPK
ncbi:MAG TPA: response regulator [Burkholderiaceae bacterium]|nr:response regulator [Burkholderiaceae bacterium]